MVFLVFGCKTIVLGDRADARANKNKIGDAFRATT